MSQEVNQQGDLRVIFERWYNRGDMHHLFGVLAIIYKVNQLIF
jgi:hypothetical protein